MSSKQDFVLSRRCLLACLPAFLGFGPHFSAASRSTAVTAPWEAVGPTYLKLKAALDAVPAVDTHDHLFPFDQLPGCVETDRGRGMTLAGLWRNSYLNWIHRLPEWPAGGSFEQWWAEAKHEFETVRATSFYRYTHIAIRDLYGLDFETISDEQARELNDRIFLNYQDERWLYHVITERANIELMLNDTYWAPFDFRTHYSFEVQVLRLNPLFRGFHPTEFTNATEDPYHFADKEAMKVDRLDDYLDVIDRLFRRAKEAGVVCLKSTLAYQRGLDFENVSKERAARAFGRPRGDLSSQEIRDFEDFIMWRLCELSALHDLPFQIHTGHARIQGSNPMLLVDLIHANPATKFILFHGGYPWVGETAMIVMDSLRRGRNVWIDSVWLPQISRSVAVRAFREWLDVMPSDRILWGGDCNHAEGIYGAAELTRGVLAEVLGERVNGGRLRVEYAVDIGRRILRENALELFPSLRARLGKHKSPPSRPLKPLLTTAVTLR